MDLVTIIVPVYNVEKYLNECIASLMNQTYQNLEIILVDDGSTDACGRLCDIAGKKDERIKTIHKKNGGLGFARNSGLEIANGKYVVFIDSDDTVDNDLVSDLMKPVLQNNVDTCISGFKKMSESGDLQFEEKYESVLYEGDDVYTELFARMLGSSVNKHDAIRMSACGVLYSMNIICQHNLRFHSERNLISEDLVWNSDYYRYARKAMVIDSIGYNYRTTPGSLTKRYKSDRFEMVCIFYHEMCMRIGNNPEMRTRLQRQFFVNVRVCLKQEKPSISGKKYYECKEKIESILNDSTLINILNEYPINKIQMKQRVFLLLLKYKKIDLISFLINIGII